MDEQARHAEQRRLIEEFGLLLEGTGGTRMAGRVAGLLLLCDPPVQSLSAIAESLGVSKGAVSDAARLLLRMNLIERVSEPGRRGDWYRIQSGLVDAMFRTEPVGAMRDLLDRALVTVADKDAGQSNYALMRDLRDFQAFLERELPALKERWEKKRTRHTT